MTDLLECVDPYVSFLGGGRRVVRRGDTVDPADPVVAGNEHRFQAARASNVVATQPANFDRGRPPVTPPVPPAPNVNAQGVPDMRGAGAVRGKPADTGRGPDADAAAVADLRMAGTPRQDVERMTSAPGEMRDVQIPQPPPAEAERANQDVAPEPQAEAEEEDALRCDACGRKFGSAGGLASHRRTHE